MSFASAHPAPALAGRRVLADALPGARARDAALVLGSAALVGVCAQVAVPLPFTPVPLTLQPFAVLLASAALGSRRGAAGMGVYLLLGLAGLPWFAQHHGGLAVATGASFGYLLSYPLVGAVVGALAQRRGDRTPLRAAGSMVLGLATIYALGVGWLMAVLHVGLAEGLALGMTPFLLGDLVKVVVAAALLPAAWKLVSRR